MEERLSLIIRAKANVTSTLKTIRQQKRLVEIEVTRLQAELDQTDMLIVNAGRVNYWTLVVNDVGVRLLAVAVFRFVHQRVS